MRDDARAKAAIEILDNFLKGSNLNNTFEEWSKNNKFAGSGDREKIRDIVFDILRVRNTLEAPLGHHKIAESGRSLMVSYILFKSIEIEDIFTGSKYGPPELNNNEQKMKEKFVLIKNKFFNNQYNIPAFLVEDLKHSLSEKFENIMSVLGNRAPTFIRVNIKKTNLFSVSEKLKNEGITSEVCLESRQGLKILSNFRRVKMTKMFQEGLFEFQDLNSQKVIEDCNLVNQTKFLDFCAGAGGKTLCLASLRKGKGDFYAYDINKSKLEKLKVRAKKAGIKIGIIKKKDFSQVRYKFDCVILDVPCSGSGAWRRNPQQKWRITQKKINDLTRLQFILLQQAKNFLQNNGKLIYITCSFLRTENERIIEKFLYENPFFSIVKQKNYYPSEDGDGFYCAELIKRNEF